MDKLHSLMNSEGKDMAVNQLEQSVFTNEYKGIQVRGPDRRRNNERRSDPREEKGAKSFWLRLISIFKPRSGVDRRKNDRRQTIAASSKAEYSAELTAEEISHLLR